MNLIELLRAKSEREGEEGKNILLKDHIIEALERLKQLNTFIKANESEITYETVKDEKFFASLAIAIILHDLGKITYDFQRRLHDTDSDEWKELKELLKPSIGIKIRHEILSALWASIVLDGSDADDWKVWFSKIRTAILLHHYNEYYIGEKDLMEIVQNYLESIEKYLKFIIEKKKKLNEFLTGVLDEIGNKFGDSNPIIRGADIIRKYLDLKRAEELLTKIKNRGDDISTFAEFYEIDNENPDYDFLVFLGCLRRCDYSASGEVDLEGMNGDIIKVEELFKDIDKKIKEKIGKEPDWQKQLIKKIKHSKSIVLVAPTGAGKTEFALLWNTKNARKLIYTLPLRVALNDLFWRFKDKYFNEDVVNVLHSTAFIEYLEEEQEGKTLTVDKKLTTSKILSSPILLTTPDQVFLTSLNYYGSDKVISIYPLSSIVIDEIQTYNPEMAAIIIKTLQIIQKLGGKVLVMTATLPPYFEPFFFNNVNKDYDIPEEVKLNFEMINTQNVEIKNYELKRHKIEIINEYLATYEKSDDESYLIKVNENVLRDYLKKYDGKNIFIVLNNAGKAIEVYKCIENKYPNVFLLHSRLIEKEKSRRIDLTNLILKLQEFKEKSCEDKEKIIKKIEKLRLDFEKIDTNKPVIVIATQIIEASIDLDFDVMLTEVSPVDSQVQRWGRIHRNRDYNYDEDLPNIVIFVGEEENGKIKVDIGTRAIYDKRVVEKTIEILKEYENNVLSYETEKKMIEQVFGKKVEVKNSDIIKSLEKTEATLKEIYVAEIKQYLDFLKYFSVEKKSQAQQLFRRIAGYQVVIPEIMKIDGDDVNKAFAGIVEDPSSNKMTWKEIIGKLREKGFNLDGNENEWKWKLKKMLYQHSLNVPVFYWENFQHVIKQEFQGFYVLKVDRNFAEGIQKYGLEKNVVDKIINKFEEEWLEENIF